MYDEDFEERRSLRSEDFDGRSRLTSNREDTTSNFGSESYAPSRNMFQNADKKGLADKEPLAGEIQEGETAEVLKESSARRRWVALCWILTWWVPTPCLTYVGRMKRLDVRQAWREKLALNMLIWFVCGCAVFVIAVLGLVICPTEHVFNQNELASHSYTENANNVYTSIRGEVFDLTSLAATHERVVDVIPAKSILKTYGGTSSDDIFPVQVCFVLHTFSRLVHEFCRHLGQRALQWYHWCCQPVGCLNVYQRHGPERAVSRFPSLHKRLPA